MQIHLIRHTKTGAPAGTCYGQSDVPLASSFAHECGALLQELRGRLNPERQEILLFTSPLQRCKSLAEVIAKSWNVKLLEEPGLMELNFGAWEGRPYNELPAEELNHWMEDFVHRCPPQGESYWELHQRVYRAFRRMLMLAVPAVETASMSAEEQKSPQAARLSGNDSAPVADSVTRKEMLIVTHGGVIRCFLKILLGASLEKAFQLKVDYGDVLSFTVPDPVNTE